METFYGWNVCVRRGGARWMWQQALELLEPAHWFVAGQRNDGVGHWPNCALTEIDPGKRETMRLTPLGQHWKTLQAQLA